MKRYIYSYLTAQEIIDKVKLEGRTGLIKTINFKPKNHLLWTTAYGILCDSCKDPIRKFELKEIEEDEEWVDLGDQKSTTYKISKYSSTGIILNPDRDVTEVSFKVKSKKKENKLCLSLDIDQGMEAILIEDTKDEIYNYNLVLDPTLFCSLNIKSKENDDVEVDIEITKKKVIKEKSALSTTCTTIDRNEENFGYHGLSKLKFEGFIPKNFKLFTYAYGDMGNYPYDRQDDIFNVYIRNPKIRQQNDPWISGMPRTTYTRSVIAEGNVEHGFRKIKPTNVDYSKENKKEKMSNRYLSKEKGKEKLIPKLKCSRKDVTPIGLVTGKNRVFPLENLFPKMDIAESEDSIDYIYSIPGIDKESIDVSIMEGEITVSGNRKLDYKKSIRSEIKWGEFSRIEKIPSDTVKKHLKTKYGNGVLIVKFPKRIRI